LPVHLVMPPALAGGDPLAGRVEVPVQGWELLDVLFPHLSGLEVSRVDGSRNAVVAFASVRGVQARCPQCGEPSARGPWPLPASGWWRTARPEAGRC
jgi:hypothetical protein